MQSCDYALAIDENNQRAMSLKVFATFAIPDHTKGLKLCLEYMRKVPNDYSIRMYAGEQLYATKSMKRPRFLCKMPCAYALLSILTMCALLMICAICIFKGRIMQGLKRLCLHFVC